MLTALKMAPSVDQTIAEHGRQMIQSGKEVIEHVMSGPQMKELHKTGHADDRLMQYTHELGEAVIKVTSMLEKMSAEGAMDSETMTMHHMHLMINHALSMAAQGSNMAILGQMKHEHACRQIVGWGGSDDDDRSPLVVKENLRGCCDERDAQRRCDNGQRHDE